MSARALTTDRGVFYLVTSEGDLQWYQDVARDGSNAQDGSTGWAPRSGAKIGNGWNIFSTVFSGGDGVLYGIRPTGELLWYGDQRRDGTVGWASNSGHQIGVGWNTFSAVFSGGDGIIYAVKPTGELLWYRDLRRDGSNAANGSTGWDTKSGSQIGTGWAGFDQVFSGGNGIIYAITSDGRLRWYRDLRRDGRNAPNGSSGWDPRSGAQIGTGWDVFTTVLPGGDGILYALTVDGFLLWYRDLAGDGTVRWANNGVGSTIRSGWFLTQPRETAVQGYAVPLSVAPGDRVDLHVSASTSYDVTILRLEPQDDGGLGTVVGETRTEPAAEHDIPAQAWSRGCGWPTALSTVVGDTWRSGIYSLHCQAQDGTETHVPFVVRPRPDAHGDLAVLANTNTWNAYNDWGGRSKYSLPPAAVLSFERPNPYASPVDDGQLNHLTRAELWVLGWLEGAGYSPDVYTDHDFHRGIENLAGYRALVMTTHPEYWTPRMFDNLSAYLDDGGCLLYLGGNGIFERVEFDDEGRTLTLLGGDANSQRARSYFRNLTPPRPERAVLGVAYRYDNYQTYAPFQVLRADHWCFAGTGLANGDLIGADGRNGAASGWEMDTSLPGRAGAGVVVSAEGTDDRGIAPAGLQLLARGTNRGYGADMTYYETDGGGFVFSAGSISFGGSLVQDPKLQAIVRNVIDTALQRATASGGRADRGL